MNARDLRIRYDKFADVLYITTPENAPARAREDDDGVLWRYAVGNGRLVGATVLDFHSSWQSRRTVLAEKVSSRFEVRESEIESILSAAE